MSNSSVALIALGVAIVIGGGMFGGAQPVLARKRNVAPQSHCHAFIVCGEDNDFWLDMFGSVVAGVGVVVVLKQAQDSF